jgi:hypothetical protein
VTPLDDFIIGRLRGTRRLNSQWTLAFACTPRIQRRVCDGFFMLVSRGFGRRQGWLAGWLRNPPGRGVDDRPERG